MISKTTIREEVVHDPVAMRAIATLRAWVENEMQDGRIETMPMGDAIDAIFTMRMPNEWKLFLAPGQDKVGRATVGLKAQTWPFSA